MMLFPSLLVTALFGSSPAFATSGFDPVVPSHTFTGTEVEDVEGSIRLWSAIERHEDPDRTLFAAGEYNSVTQWPDSASWAPYIAECFGSNRPHTSSFLLHVGPSAPIAGGTPILFVPGAGDNGSRGFITMAWHEDLLGRPVYALTFAHSHGDVFQHAEQIADAIARIKERTGAAEVDVVAHSKGGIAAAVYASNYADADWDNAAYESVGTVYRDDVRRLILIATPLDGIDTAFRWSMGNLTSLEADTAFSPSAWTRYYPYTTAVSWTYDELAQQDFAPEGGDLFPGHRQMYRRQDYDLPGSMSWLGVYAMQPDWYTTYEGGLGYYSQSEGIDATVADGGGLLYKLEANGVDPAVEIFLLAGNNPVMPNGYEDWAAANYSDGWSEMGQSTAEQWSDIIASAIGEGLMSEGLTENEVQGLVAGDLVLGEITGESDGLVFVSSATSARALTARGAEVKATHIANLSHLDLLYASPITGELLIDAGAANESDAWMISFGERYTSEDTIGIVEEWLADDEVPTDTGVDDTGGETGVVDSGEIDTGDSVADSGDGDTDQGYDTEEPSELPEECGACNGGPALPQSLGLVLGVLAALRRRVGRSAM